MTSRVLVLGGNFAGLTAALHVKQELRDDVDLTVVSTFDRFQFNPSSSGSCSAIAKLGHRVSCRADLRVEPGSLRARRGDRDRYDGTAVMTSQGAFGYDYLVIATRYRDDFDVVPGLGPGGNAYSITHLDGAVDAAAGWARIVNDPGPIVVGATQGAACFGAAYEFLFNIAYHLKKQRLRVPVTYVSAEPFAGHFGIGGLPGGEKLLRMFFKHTASRGSSTSRWTRSRRARSV
jgi:NADPH-dependent 2,4-dienoyl-CoA reductase/sulfur reductase-like enzyme